MNPADSVRSIAIVAKKEFLHILRDWRILVLIFTLPLVFTLLLGHAFEEPTIADAPALLHDADGSPESAKLADKLRENKTFQFRDWSGTATDLIHAGVRASVTIPEHWSASLKNGDPLALQATLDGTDTNTAPQLEGALQQTLGEFQLEARQDMIDQMPESVIEMGKQLPEETRKQFVSSMTPWTVKSEILYNPKLRFIDFVMPGIVGLILQLLTVTLMACTVARERESGTLSQLLVSPLHRNEIVAGKVIPYLGVSIILISLTLATGHFHFHVNFRAPLLLSALCFLFLLCSLGTGLLISAFCRTQAQAIQFTIFYLLPVFPLSGSFAALDSLPPGIRTLAQFFPLTHFCQAFRLLCLANAGFPAILSDLGFLLLGAILTCTGAAVLLRRVQD